MLDNTPNQKKKFLLYMYDLFPAQLNPGFVCCFVIKLVTVTEEACLQSRIQTYNFLGTGNVRSLSNKSGYKRGNKCNLVFRYVCSTFMKFKWNPGYFINALTLSTFFICNKSVCWLHLKWKNVYNASKRVWAFLWHMGMKLWKYQHHWANRGIVCRRIC